MKEKYKFKNMCRFVLEVQDISDIQIFQVNSAAKFRNIDFRQTSPVIGLQRCVKGKITVQFVDRLLTASILDISKWPE